MLIIVVEVSDIRSHEYRNKIRIETDFYAGELSLD